MELEKFITIANTRPYELLGKEVNIENFYDYYGLPKTLNLSITVIKDYIHDCIRRNLSSNFNDIKAVCSGLIKNLFFKLPENNTSIEMLCGIIEEVYNAIRKNNLAPLGEACDWEKVFTIATDAAYINQLIDERRNDRFLQRYNREFELIKAAKLLRGEWLCYKDEFKR